VPLALLLHENNQKVDETDNMAGLTRLYTDKSIDFLKHNKERPFFLYLAHTMVHSVIDVSPEFKGKSKGGLYGDVVQELDYHCGRLLDALDELGLKDNTLVLFTTDNGPWNNFRTELEKKHDGQIAWGSSGPLREGKGSTYEGGLRVPCLVRWPGKVPAGRVSDAIFATIDFLPTFAKLSGCDIPKDRLIDGVDQSDLLLGKSDTGARHDYFYFCKNELHAVRKGNFKLMLADRRQHYNYVKDKGSNDVELYDLSVDIGEKNNLAAERPGVVRELLEYATSVPMPDARPDDRINLTANAQKIPTELKMGDWLAHNFSESGRKKIDSDFQAGVDRGVIPGGSLLILHRGEVIHRKAYGLADLESKRAFSVDAPCRIASLTKPHTATLMSILADQGKIKLTDTIDVYLPEFRTLRIRGKEAAQRAPTLLECLSHTAGFPGNDATRGSESPLVGFATLGQAVAQLAKEDLVTAPGTHYDYSRCGYLAAGRVAEVVTGRTFQDLMRRYLFEPIGAEVATFIPDEETRIRIPTQYERTPRGLVERNRDDVVRFVNPGGSLVSTVDDVARLMLLHRNAGRVGDRH
jgi:CubicO group peptidase (beta-lactamase class C family)